MAARASTKTPSFWRRWPATTATGSVSMVCIGVLLATSAPQRALESSALDRSGSEEGESLDGLPTIEEEESEVSLVSEFSFDGAEVVPELEMPFGDDDGTRHKGEEGSMGKPTSKSKSGLYAMKGPADAVPSMARSFDPGSAAEDAGVLGVMSAESGHFVASDPPGEGLGGLGLVGTGRGGGGTGEGSIGLGAVGHGSSGGSGSAYGSGSGPGVGGKGKGDRGLSPEADERRGYDRALQARRLTAGVIDDASDEQRYGKYLDDMEDLRTRLDLDPKFAQREGRTSVQRHAPRPERLEIALVIDTTGSMGDELEYLKVELEAIATEVEAEFPGVDQSYAMVVYRDQGDDYVTRASNFHDVSTLVRLLGNESAGGGGDFPEAMDAAMDKAARLPWSEDCDAAKMVFLVADAPPHDEGVQRYARSIDMMRARNVALYPVAASGVADTAEYLMRTGAKVTGGQYLFLTDHSGVGSPHAKPHIDKYEVETLHGAMHRMIRGELGALDDADAVAVDQTCESTLGDWPGAEGTILEPASAEHSYWTRVKDRLVAHFGFASMMAFGILFALGLDTRRRRRG